MHKSHPGEQGETIKNKQKRWEDSKMEWTGMDFASTTKKGVGGKQLF